MIQPITSSKQVGEVYYMTDSLESLYNILKQGQIKTSSKKEKPAGSSVSEYFVSLTRNYKRLHAQNPSRWHCGIILDGDVLSETYSIDPLHFVGNAIEAVDPKSRSGSFKIKQITAWEDGTFDIKFVGWSRSFEITEQTYTDIVEQIENLDEETRDKCKLEITTGRSKSPVKGCKFIERFLFNSPGGGPPKLLKMLSDAATQEIRQLTDQHEERIHGPVHTYNMHPKFHSLDTAAEPILPYIYLKDAVAGIVVSAEDFHTTSDAYNMHNEKLYKQCRELLVSKYRLRSYVIEEI